MSDKPKRASDHKSEQLELAAQPQPDQEAGPRRCDARSPPGTRGWRVPPERILLRVFCHALGRRLVLLLGGYDKSDDTTKKRQSKEIEAARARLRRWEARRQES